MSKGRHLVELFYIVCVGEGACMCERTCEVIFHFLSNWIPQRARQLRELFYSVCVQERACVSARAGIVIFKVAFCDQ